MHAEDHCSATPAVQIVTRPCAGCRVATCAAAALAEGGSRRLPVPSSCRRERQPYGTCAGPGCPCAPLTGMTTAAARCPARCKVAGRAGCGPHFPSVRHDDRGHLVIPGSVPGNIVVLSMLRTAEIRRQVTPCRPAIAMQQVVGASPLARPRRSSGSVKGVIKSKYDLVEKRHSFFEYKTDGVRI